MPGGSVPGDDFPSRLAEIMRNMPVSYSNEDQTVQGVGPETFLAPPPAYNGVAHNAACNPAFYGDDSDDKIYSEKF